MIVAPDWLGWVIVIHLLLLLGAAAYGSGLQKIHDKYAPDHVYLTVIGGEAIVGLAWLLLCLLGATPWISLLWFFTLEAAAGLPIVIWQRRQAAARAAERRLAERQAAKRIIQALSSRSAEPEEDGDGAA